MMKSYHNQNSYLILESDSIFKLTLLTHRRCLLMNAFVSIYDKIDFDVAASNIRKMKSRIIYYIVYYYNRYYVVQWYSSASFSGSPSHYYATYQGRHKRLVTNRWNLWNSTERAPIHHKNEEGKEDGGLPL